jgi:hypothetical protein
VHAGAVEAWEYDPSCDLGEIVRLAAERVAPPSFTGVLLATRGDALSVQLLEGDASEAGALYYVSGHGAFSLARREVWPPVPGRRGERVLLILVAYPPARAVATR